MWIHTPSQRATRRPGDFLIGYCETLVVAYCQTVRSAERFLRFVPAPSAGVERPISQTQRSKPREVTRILPQEIVIHRSEDLSLIAVRWTFRRFE